MLPVEPVAPREIKKYYNKNKNKFLTGKQYKFSVITIFSDRTGRDDSRPADVIIEDALTLFRHSGNFAYAARKYSEDIFAKNSGQFTYNGRTYSPLRVLASWFVESLKKAKENDILGPLKGDNSVVMIKLEDISGGEPLPLERVSKDIQKLLMQQKQAKTLDKYLKELRETAGITINPIL
jgi:parvulin-like peptidyl-prolyl isomerase